MGDPIPPDPYRALGIDRDATAAQIKTAYRKLALTCHPDKVPGKGDEFHKISQAYELIGDEDKKRKYDDSIRLDSLRREVYGRRPSAAGPDVEIRTAAFDVRSNGNPGVRFTARGPERYEERRPKERTTPYEEDAKFGDSYFDMRASSRKYDGYEASPRKPPPQPSSKDDMYSKTKSDKTKMNPREREREKKKQRDKDFARERGRKNFNGDEMSSEDDWKFEGSRRFDPERSRFAEPPPERRRSEDSFMDERARKLQAQEESIREYMARSQDGPPPPPRRSNSYQEEPREARKSDSRERERKHQAFVRKPNSRQTSSPKKAGKGGKSSDSDRERGSPEPAASSERRMPSFQQSRSSPSEIKIPEPRRSRGSYDADYETRSPPRSSKRADNMGSSQTRDSRAQAAGPRRDSTTPMYSSNLRHTETNEARDSGYSTSNSPADTPGPQMPQTSKKYHFGDPSKNDESTTVNVEYDSGNNNNNNSYTTAFREPPTGRRASPPSPPPISTRDSRPLPRRQGSSYASPMAQSPQGPPQPQQGPPATATSSRRPSVQRNDSSNGNTSTRRAPDLKTTGRVASMPLPIRTDSSGNIRSDGQFFNEIRQTSSPTEMQFPSQDFTPSPTSGGRDRDRDRERDRDSKKDRERDRSDRERDRDRDMSSKSYRYVPEGVAYGKRYTSDDVKYTSYNSQPPQGRKSSASGPGYDYTESGLSERTAQAAYLAGMEEGRAGPAGRNGSGRFGIRREATMA